MTAPPNGPTGGSHGLSTDDRSGEPVKRAKPAEVEARFYGEDVEVLTPGSYEDLQEELSRQSSKGKVVIPSGLGQHAYVGNPPAKNVAVLSLRRLNKVLRYEPDDFTIGVQAGMTHASLKERLAANHQELPVDFPLSPGGSIGGAVALNWTGPRQGRYGTLRSFLIGASGMRADRTIYRAGGMVVKNVAGYEVAKVLAGSLGTLGIILELNLKLRPIPACRSGQLAGFGDASSAWAFAREFRRRLLEPAALAVLDPEAAEYFSSKLDSEPVGGWTLFWLFEGNPGAVGALDRAVEDLRKETPAKKTEAASLDAARCEQALQILSGFQQPEDPLLKDHVIVRVATLSSNTEKLQKKILDLASTVGARAEGSLAEPYSGCVIARLTGDFTALEAFITECRAAVVPLRGNGRILFASPELKRVHPFLLRPDPNAKIARNIQKVFDPTGTFHVGRLSPS